MGGYVSMIDGHIDEVEVTLTEDMMPKYGFGGDTFREVLYKSPIKIESLHSRLVEDVNKDTDERIISAVRTYGVNVDKEELLKALRYDREQYDAGFTDGYRAAEPKWISVKDMLPEEYKPVLICRDDGVVENAYLKNAEKKEWRIYGTQLHCVTHWMPLPAAPTEVE